MEGVAASHESAEEAGQEGKRAFVAGLLNGGTGMDDEKNHPLYHVL